MHTVLKMGEKKTVFTLKILNNVVITILNCHAQSGYHVIIIWYANVFGNIPFTFIV